MTKALTNVLNEETMVALQGSYPVEPGANKILLPRLGMVSQDVTEGKGKQMKVVAEAGTFFIEKETDEINEETGKKIWDRTDIGTTIEGIILFQRKQLKMYDKVTGEFTSSPVYDKDDEVLPLWCNKSEVARGTPEDLKKKYKFTDEDGKVKSKLEDNRILYVLYNDEAYQLNLRGSSMYSFLGYARKTLPPSVITVFNSESKEKGTIAWNQMTFVPKRKLTQKEADEILAKVDEIRTAVQLEKNQYAKKGDSELTKFTEELKDGAKK